LEHGQSWSGGRKEWVPVDRGEALSTGMEKASRLVQGRALDFISAKATPLLASLAQFTVIYWPNTRNSLRSLFFLSTI
jgi:hypothetical protein